jgi:hypothetical protein
MDSTIISNNTRQLAVTGFGGSSVGVTDSAVAAFFAGRGDSFSISASEVCFLFGLVGRFGLCERRGL